MLSLKVSQGYHDFRDQVRGWFRHYLWLHRVSEERDRLIEENRELTFKIELLTRELSIRQRYEELWGYKYELWNLIGGRVIYQDPADLYRDLWIHLSAPLPPTGGYVVLSPEGVVGRVIRVTGSFAHVLTVLDPDSAVDVITNRGTRGIAQGVGKSTGRLRFVAQGDPLEVGEELITTGKDRFFPPSLRVGWIEKIYPREGEIFKDVEIRFATDFRRLTWVKVLQLPSLPP